MSGISGRPNLPDGGTRQRKAAALRAETEARRREQEQQTQTEQQAEQEAQEQSTGPVGEGGYEVKDGDNTLRAYLDR